MKPDVCEYCYFYKSLFKESKGECHRFPPQVTQGLTGHSSRFPKVYGYSSRFPEVHGDNWCGEFKTNLMQRI